MLCDHSLLCERISSSLYRNPNVCLVELSQQLHVCRRTIQNAVIAVKGKRFRALRDELLLARVENSLMSSPSLTIKELSFEIGYRSPRSFSRAVRRACGASPEQLRALAGELAGCKT